MTDRKPQTADHVVHKATQSSAVSHQPPAVGSRLMLAFEGYKPPDDIRRWIARRSLAGFTLFRGPNVRSTDQVRRLTADLQKQAGEAGRPTLLIATDQEGGQLMALGEGTTPFPGNMALGATRDGDLAHRVGLAIGRELAALGVNVNYAPVCDVNSNPGNPNVGIRAFGDDPQLVAELGAAMIRGLQEAGVAATAKHFPGNGHSAIDPHFGLPTLPQARDTLEAGAFMPFRAAIEAGTCMMMSAHVALPQLTGRDDLPATLQQEIMSGLLREEMGFEGLLISDAMDMQAISQGAGQIVDAIAALRAGIDVLLLTTDKETQERLYQGLKLARSRDLISQENMDGAGARLRNLQQWLASQAQPSLDVLGSSEHHRLAQEVAERSITLLRDQAQLLPLKLDPGDRIVVVMPRPVDLTPADTSSYVTPALATALRAHHPRVDEYITAHPPSDEHIAAIKEALRVENTQTKSILVLVTLSASMQPAQATLARELLALGLPTITVAARTPYDLSVYPQSQTHLCTYDIQTPTMRALAAALFGQIPFRGRLPVTIPDLYDFGQGLTP